MSKFEQEWVNPQLITQLYYYFEEMDPGEKETFVFLLFFFWPGTSLALLHFCFLQFN